ncbi:hypothetical protein GCK32_008461 [Trichostrongylus colubriformis]|uniref:Uncharacterized protein n=1 Tax=Trichostrongylus colubriformis TaxID=6319 RepID=A0AAN8J217_TRICO
MGYPAGIAQWIHVSTHACIIIVVIACSWLVATILNLFNYRRHLVTPIYPALSITDRGHFYTSIGIFLIYFIPCTIGILDILPDQADAKKWVEEEYSCGKSAIFLPHIQIFTPWKVKRIAITAVSLAGVAFVTYSFHVSIPAATMFVPIVALMYILGTTNRVNRGLGNLALATLGAHGCVAALTLIMCNEPYRNFMLGPIREYWQRRKPMVIVRVSESTRSI